MESSGKGCNSFLVPRPCPLGFLVSKEPITPAAAAKGTATTSPSNTDLLWREPSQDRWTTVCGRWKRFCNVGLCGQHGGWFSSKFDLQELGWQPSVFLCFQIRTFFALCVTRSAIPEAAVGEGFLFFELQYVSVERLDIQSEPALVLHPRQHAHQFWAKLRRKGAVLLPSSSTASTTQAAFSASRSPTLLLQPLRPKPDLPVGRRSLRSYCWLLYTKPSTATR
ncbi:hypothetical protein HPP92_024373 [Vanilla planifolia]|uniref:Uncharacterized protein n=1 Tax=Vanilla planifolia TaxID=51239 RepID=A0A835UD77_VANPL|nr:hypothetical protein HPP92_024373 [Vanilla planifolia]